MAVIDHAKSVLIPGICGGMQMLEQVAIEIPRDIGADCVKILLKVTRAWDPNG